MELAIVIGKTIFFYFFVILAYRIMGKREIGQLSIIDLIVSILIAELVAISIENIKDSIILTVIPITILIGLELALGYISMKSRKFRLIFSGKPSIIIKNGIINYKEIIKQRYNMDDLLMELRQKEVKNIKDIEYAILESNGKLSIFKYNIFKSKGAYPMPLILDGEIQYDTLNTINKDENWLKNTLNNKNILNIFYAFYQKRKIYIIYKR